MINCHKAKRLMSEYLSGELSETDAAALQAHTVGCARCKEELDTLRVAWEKVGLLADESPGEGGSERFHATLRSVEEQLRLEQARPRWFDFLAGQPLRRLAPQLVMVLAALAVGWFGRGSIRAAGDRPEVTRQVEVLQLEVANLKTQVALGLMQQQSPVDRLQGVMDSSRLGQSDGAVINALLTRLNSDPSVNVRLAATNSLFEISDSPAAREGALNALPQQTSPLIQAALIEFLVSVNETRARDQLRRLRASKDIHPVIAKEAEWGLRRLSNDI